MSLLRQGIDKVHSNTKDKVLDLMYRKYLQTDPFDLPIAPNIVYRTQELMAYFSELNYQGKSGEFIKHSIFHKLKFNLPDQQTVKDRLQKYSVSTLEQNFNNYLINKVADENYFRPSFFQKGRMMALNRNKPDYDNGSNKDDTTATGKSNDDHKSQKDQGNQPSRRKLTDRRQMQRERGVQRPDGLYLAADPTNIGYQGQEDVELPDGTNLQSYIIHRQRKNSTNTFFQYHALYSYEQGVRQILGIHLKRRHLVDDEWKEENFGHIIAYLLDPVLAQLEIKGFIGDGEYYNVDVLHYLHLKDLDYVIRAEWTNELRQWCKEEGLQQKLKDGEGVEFDQGRTIGTGKQSHTTRLVVVKRGTDLVPLILPQYSDLTPEQALLLYEERFGIETNFRETKLRMGLTSAHSVQYRLALFATACSMYNLVLSYYERVVSRSQNPQEWKITLIELMDILHQFQEDYMIQAVEEAANREKEK